MRYVGLESAQARALKQLQEENVRLKRLALDPSLDQASLGMVRPARICRTAGVDDISSRKRDRPLTNGLLLQAGRDQIRAQRFQ